MRIFAIMVILGALAGGGCSQTKFKDNAKKQGPTQDLKDKNDKQKGSEDAVDCTDMSEQACRSKKEDAGTPDSFRNVVCSGLPAEQCADAVAKAVAQDGKEGSEIRVIGCIEDKAGTCAALEEKKPDNGGKIVLMDINTTDGTSKFKTPKFAFLVNDPQCAFCHVRINGDIVSTGPVNGVRADTVAFVNGSWFAASTWRAKIPGEEGDPKINFEGGGKLNVNYKGPELPHKPDGTSAFPEWSASATETEIAAGSSRVKGKDNKGGTVEVAQVANGNTVLIGTADNPIQLGGDILVKGDLVIKGVYKGVGTIYVTGNVYIPANLKAQNSAFPFPDKPDEALETAKKRLAEGRDGLAIATQKSIFIADIEMIEPSSVVGADGTRNKTETVYGSGAPDGRKAAQLGTLGVYSWIGGKAEYDKLYENASRCAAIPAGNDGTPAVNGRGAFDIVEAYLYAKNTVAGISRRNSYTINGGIIADHMHIISGAALCQTDDLHPVTGAPVKNNFLNYDHRMKQGLAILHHIGAYFTGK